MLLQGYTRKMFRPKCNPNFQSVHCVAHLDQDISEVFPYLNTVLGGSDLAESPPALTLRVHGKLIALHAKEIFVNALQDEEEADKILLWLKNEINETWEMRGEIVPSFEVPPAPQMIEILRLLPKTNCRKCGEPTCTVFAIKMAEGIKEMNDCPDLPCENLSRLEEYLGRFLLESW